MELRDSGKQLNEAMISEFEKQFDFKLPQDYKAFMLKNNGGTPKKNWAFDFVDTASGKSDSSGINYFCILYDEETENNDDLRASYIALVLEEPAQSPPNLLPILDDPGGNIVFLSVAGKDYGKVYFGDHELEDPETGYLVMSPIADSFSEFIDKCYEFVGE